MTISLEDGMSVDFSVDEFALQNVAVGIANGAFARFHPLAVFSAIHTPVFEVGGPVSLAGALHPLAGVINPMKLVVVEVENGAWSMRHCRAGKKSSPTNSALVQARVQVVFV